MLWYLCGGRLRSSIMGLLFVGIVLYLGVFHGASNPLLFINGHALILVLGGTLAVALMAFPISSLIDIAQFVIFNFLIKKKHEFKITVLNLIEAIFDYSYNPTNLVKRSARLHPFILDCLSLLNNPELNDEQLEDLFHSRAGSFVRKYQDEAKLLVSLSKFPPALGLLGASTGMIEMMNGVDGGGTNGIGGAMAVALVATFWGIALANLIILPLSDFAFHQAEEEKYMRATITEGILMLKRDYPPRVIMMHLFNKLTPVEKLQINDQFKKVIKKANDMQAKRADNTDSRIQPR